MMRERLARDGNSFNKYSSNVCFQKNFSFLLKINKLKNFQPLAQESTTM
jgi:hypothetical protein